MKYIVCLVLGAAFGCAVAFYQARPERAKADARSAIHGAATAVNSGADWADKELSKGK